VNLKTWTLSSTEVPAGIPLTKFEIKIKNNKRTGTMGRVKGMVSLLLFPRPHLLVTQRDLCGEERNTELYIDVLRKQASV